VIERDQSSHIVTERPTLCYLRDGVSSSAVVGAATRQNWSYSVH